MTKKKGDKKENKKIDLDWEKLYLSIKELGEKQEETDKILKRSCKKARRNREDNPRTCQKAGGRQETTCGVQETGSKNHRQLGKVR